MGTINELNTTDTLADDDKLVLWKTQAGATRAITAEDAATYFSLAGGPYQPLDELLTAIAGLGPSTAAGDFIELTAQDTVRVRKLSVATYAALTVIPASFRFDDMLVYVASRATDGDGGEGWWRFDAASSATANGGTILVPDAGTGRWIRLETVFDVTLFGAKGDNSTDDTAAIQAAIDAAEAASAASSLVVCYVDFPRGVYRHTALTIEVDRVVLRSTDGARLVKTSTTGEGIKFFSAAGRIFQNGIEGLVLGAAGTHTGGSLLNVEQCGQFAVAQLTVSPFPSAPWRGIFFDNVSQATVTNLAVQGCLEIGAIFEDCIDFYITSSRCDANASHGWLFNTSAGIYGVALTSFNNGGCGYRIIQTIPVPIISTAGSSFQFFTNCIADTNGSHNWEIDTLEQSILTGCWGASQNNTTIDLHGFSVTNATEVQFDGCIATANNAAGLLVTDSQIVITGGFYSENGRQSGSTYDDGVVLGSGAAVIMDGVTMTDTESPKTQDYGLRVLSGVTRLQISNCNMSGNATYPYTFAAIPTNFREFGNFTAESTDVASASTVTLPVFGSVFTITGTTQINALGDQWLGREVTLRFSGASLLVADAGSLDIAGNMVTAAGDILSLMSDGTTWTEVSRTYANGSISSRSVINNAWQYRSDGYNVHTIANGASLDLAAGSGLILIVDNADGAIAAFIAGGATVTKLGGAAKFVVGAPGAGEVGVLFGTTTYRVTNGLGSSGTFWISGLAVRNSA
jgi:hypothetical protein